MTKNQCFHEIFSDEKKYSKEVVVGNMLILISNQSGKHSILSDFFSIFRTLRHLLNPFQMQKRMPKMGVKSSHFLPEKERKFLFYSFVSVKSVNRALILDKKVLFFVCVYDILSQQKYIKDKIASFGQNITSKVIEN